MKSELKEIAPRTPHQFPALYKKENAPLFKGSPSNCKFHLDWKEFLE